MLHFLDPIARVYEKIHGSLDEWNRPAPIAKQISPTAEQVVDFLNQVPGMTQAESRDFKYARPIFTLRDGSVVRTWKNPLGIDHLFLATQNGEMIFGGFVGWQHSEDLQNAIAYLRKNFT